MNFSRFARNFRQPLFSPFLIGNHEVTAFNRPTKPKNVVHLRSKILFALSWEDGWPQLPSFVSTELSKNGLLAHAAVRQVAPTEKRPATKRLSHESKPPMF